MEAVPTSAIVAVTTARATTNPTTPAIVAATNRRATAIAAATNRAAATIRPARRGPATVVTAALPTRAGPQAEAATDRRVVAVEAAGVRQPRPAVAAAGVVAAAARAVVARGRGTCRGGGAEGAWHARGGVGRSRRPNTSSGGRRGGH